MLKPTTDIYADDRKPEAAEQGMRVMVRMPLKPGERSTYTVYATVIVHRDSYTELDSWLWFGMSNLTVSVKHRFDYQKAIYEWLSEWEFIELKPIGPEDSEYFATDKLMKVAYPHGTMGNS